MDQSETRKDKDLAAFVENLEREVKQNPESVGIKQKDADNLKELLESFQAALENVALMRNAYRAAAKNKKRTRQALETFARTLARRIQHNSETSDVTRARLKLKIPDATRKRVETPQTRPLIFSIDANDQFTHKLIVGDDATNRRRRPAAVIGFEIWVYVGTIGDNAADKEFRFIKTASTSPAAIEFDENNVGKQAFYRLRWVNRRGETGDWGKIFSQTITG